MLGTLTRSQKSKAAPKATSKPAVRGAPAAAKPLPTQAKTEARPVQDAAVSGQDRNLLIARAAYFRAEKRGFAPGGELQDWVEAEAEVLQLTGGR
jgi:hypothetical protein